MTRLCLDNKEDAHNRDKGKSLTTGNCPTLPQCVDESMVVALNVDDDDVKCQIMCEFMVYYAKYYTCAMLLINVIKIALCSCVLHH